MSAPETSIKEEEKEEREMENLTPHDITIVDGDCEEVKTIPASGKVARLEMSTKKIGELGEIPITTTITDGTVELPPLHDKKMYIVSRVVASALPDRKDLLFPDQLVRDEDGRVIGCKSLSTLNPDIQRGGIDEHHL